MVWSRVPPVQLTFSRRYVTYCSLALACLPVAFGWARAAAEVPRRLANANTLFSVPNTCCF